MNHIEELHTIFLTEEYREWMAEWFDTELEEMLNEPHWGMAEEDPEVSDNFVPALLWVEPEHY